MSDGRTFWDREVHEPTHNGWMDPVEVRFYINERITGDRHLWPLDAFQRVYPARLDRVLSIGCGTGALERDLIRRNIATRVDAFDASVASIDLARRAATEEGMAERIRYFAADFNRPAFSRVSYDAVFIHQALHHVGKLEKLMLEILNALRPGGLLYLDEYIGPSRDQWTDEELAPFAAQFRAMPASLRRSEELSLPIHPDDPTEAIRSGEIVKQLRLGFDFEHFRGYGGAILSVIGPQLRIEDASPEVLRQLIDRDRTVPRDFYAVVVARPKQGAAKTLARIRYFTEPKVKRIGREARRVASMLRKR